MPQHEVSHHNAATCHVTAIYDRCTGLNRHVPVYDGVLSSVVRMQQALSQKVPGEKPSTKPRRDPDAHPENLHGSCNFSGAKFGEERERCNE